MKYICFFHEPQATDIALVGGKGTNLGNMTAAGFPIPPGFCITAAAYRYLTETTGLNPIIRRKLAQTDLQNPQAVSKTSACIRAIIGQQPIPVEIAQEIETAYAALARQTNHAPDSQLPVAVRSSATAEDLPDASFAGQQDTYLNIRGRTSLLEHVRHCWASLWTTRAITYRHKQGYDHQQVYLAVVVQAMVEPQTAGIAFTANPVSGSLYHCVINASWGLGEAVVSGLVSPDTYVVSKEDGRIIDQHIARKERMIISGSNGGALEIDTAKHLREAPALSLRQISELTALCSRIEEHYGRPQDIEWALRDDSWYILQSRPVTTLQTAVSQVTVSGRYSRAMFTEIFPEAISPAFISVVTPLLSKMLDFTFQKLGMPLPAGIEPVRDFYNQPYFNAGYIEAAFASLPDTDRRHLANQFINPISNNQERHPLSFTQLQLLVRMLRFWRQFKRQLPDLLSQFRAGVDALDALPLDSTSEEEIVAQIRDMVFQGAARLLNGDFLLIALAGTFNRITLRILQRYFADEAPEIFNGLITGVTGNVIMETNKLLWTLAQQARSNPEVQEALLAGDPDTTLSLLTESAAGQRFLHEFNAVLDICGHREMHLDILYPTWGEDPTPVLAYIRGYLDASPKRNPTEREMKLVTERQALTVRVLSRMQRTLSGRLLFAPLFNWLLAQIHQLLRERDTMHFEWTRLFPPCRKLLFALGRRWTQLDLFDTPEDIFFLRLEEMNQLIQHPQPQHDLIRSRRHELATNLNGPWPEQIEEGHEIFRETVRSQNGRLVGVAGSPGKVTGPCRIINGPQDFSRLQSGDILVAPLTNPVWTPLFAIAAGLITDVGGILSHGAIVAREYGIPAVMSVSGATEHLSDGQLVTVDGTKGTISLFPTNAHAPK